MTERAFVGAIARPSMLVRALRLEYLTVGWNVVEGVISVAAAAAAASVVLLGFGIDSFVESASGAILIWRFVAERRRTDPEEIEAIENRAQRLVALSIFGLAAYIAYDGVTSLLRKTVPSRAQSVWPSRPCQSA